MFYWFYDYRVISDQIFLMSRNFYMPQVCTKHVLITLSVDPETQGVNVTVPHENGDTQTNFR